MARREAAEPDLLIIDRAAAAEIPSADALREWARGKRGFISSVMGEMPAEREAAAAAIRAVGGTPVMFELFGGRDADPEDAYLGEIETSDVYVGLLGRRYGKPLPTRYSATHTEYLHAEKSGLRVALWCSNADDREGHEQTFLDEVRTFHVVPAFTSPKDLQAQVEDRLRTIAAEDLAPWCKLGNIVFRASEVVDAGGELAVTARVRNDEVAYALEALRGDSVGRGAEARFTWAGRSRYVRVASMKTTTTAARSRTFHLQLETRQDQSDPLIEMSVNGRSAAELTELALRTALFDEPSPMGNQHMSFFAEMSDPLEPLRGADVPDEIARPLAELLLVDALVGSGRAVRVQEFRLGAALRGMRRLTLAWEPPRICSSERAPARRIEGQVQL